MFGAIESAVADVNERRDLLAAATDLAQRLPTLAPSEKRTILTTIVHRVDLLPDTLAIHILPGRLPSLLRDDTDQHVQMRAHGGNEPIITFTLPARLKRVGMETRLLVDSTRDGARQTPDHSLHRLLAQAYRYHDMVMQNGGKTMAQLAADAGIGGSYFTRILRLSFLAPDIVKAILRDKHPIELSAKHLIRNIRLPIDWHDQRALLRIE